MKKSLDSQFISTLLEASDYRSFILVWMNENSKDRKLSYSDIARIGGFSARSFPRDVIKGDKRLTLSSLPKFSKGLRLHGDLADFFRLLVEIEHEDCRTKYSDSLKLYEMKNRLKSRLLAKNDLTASSDEAFKIAHLPEVYAALGSVDFGANFNEILDRTSLSETEVQLALDHMLKTNMLLKKKTRFYPQQNLINLEGLNQSEIFKKHFIWGSERAARTVKSGLSSDSKLFLSSAFSVNQQDLPKLKEELRSVLLKFVDTSEKNNGNKVINLVVSLF